MILLQKPRLWNRRIGRSSSPCRLHQTDSSVEGSLDDQIHHLAIVKGDHKIDLLTKMVDS